ncbi:hypothetical protein RVS70_05310 [Virgibacillus sp. M23]|uniref:hypothetical protein n=1 Tax=Virgibacillus sp. M23 TaxID=3079030 RepID=UPI002A90A6D9|nr:hypothetical protein [Virgibacillus sp. M23]MDY7043619.1 hypothetical protein [Virgibacillus sp. M23]
MKIIKSDWSLVKEAEEQGWMASMTGLVERNRTELNDKLSNYFREQLPEYNGSYDEYEGEDILFSINSYLEDNEIDKSPLDFPITNGTDVHLIPITSNLKLKVLVTDEYYGSGDYSKYVLIDFFMINENTTMGDVDMLVNFIRDI